MPFARTRRSFLKNSAALASANLLTGQRLSAQRPAASKPLMAYVGTFSSPLGDVLPTQVDLPPGNGRGIHVFQIDRETGNMQPVGTHPMGTSPSCLVLNSLGTRLYSSNETDRVGENREGSVSSFSVNPTDGQLNH